MHCAKSVNIRSFSGLYFPAFRLNMEIYSVNLYNQTVRGKIPSVTQCCSYDFYVFCYFYDDFHSTITVWIVSKHGVFSGPYFSVFVLNMNTLYFCTANQLTGLYMRATLAFNGLIRLPEMLFYYQNLVLFLKWLIIDIVIGLITMGWYWTSSICTSSLFCFNTFMPHFDFSSSFRKNSSCTYLNISNSPCSNSPCSNSPCSTSLGFCRG